MNDLKVGIRSMTQAVETLSGGQRQCVAVARAAAFAQHVVIMDEPTAALGVKEGNMVLELIRRVRDKGLPVILISHNMPHVFEIADRIHVARLGKRAAVVNPKTISMSDTVAVMTGAMTADRSRRMPGLKAPMLKGIDPLLTPELLKPAGRDGPWRRDRAGRRQLHRQSIAAGKPVIRLPGVGDAAQPCEAVLSLLPLAAEWRTRWPSCGQRRARQLPLGLAARGHRRSSQPELLPGQSAEPVERFAFYERVRAAYAIVLTGEMQPFGNFILRKGVIGENLRP